MAANEKTYRYLFERGISKEHIIDGLKPVARAGIPKLFAAFDEVWHW